MEICGSRVENAPEICGEMWRLCGGLWRYVEHVDLPASGYLLIIRKLHIACGDFWSCSCFCDPFLFPYTEDGRSGRQNAVFVPAVWGSSKYAKENQY